MLQSSSSFWGLHQDLRYSQEVHPSSISGLRFSICSIYVPDINPENHNPQPLPPLSAPTPSSSGSGNSNGTVRSTNFDVSRTKEWRLYAKNNNNKSGKWSKHNESALNKHEPLPLPMAYPGSIPNAKDVEDMESCNPEKQNCKDVLYQWTGKCTRCQGTGEVSYYRKRGKETICKCVTCMGLGYVHKMTFRKDVEVMEDLDS